MDWHAGRMSSRRLLVLLRNAHEDGPYNRALRAGGFSRHEQMLAKIHEDIALLRAMHYVGGENEYQPMIFVDPRDLAERQEREREYEQIQQQADADAYAELGWT